MSHLPTHILAADHRVQLLEEAQRHGLGPEVCRAFKKLVVQAFLEARDVSSAVAHGGALILDRELGEEAMAWAVRERIPVGQPAEVSGAFPLELDPHLDTRYFPSRPAFAKCLVKGRPDDAPPLRARQHAALRRLAEGCRAHRTPLLLELIVPRAPTEDEPTFERHLRADLTARWMAALHHEGIVPDVWKLEGFSHPEGAERVATQARAGRPIVVLGKSASPSTLSTWFEAARTQSAFSGFAVGRSIFWQPFLAHLQGASNTEVVRALRDRYLDVVNRWEAAAPSGGAGGFSES